MQKKRRIFIAINLPGDIKRELEKRQKEIVDLFSQLVPEGEVKGPARIVGGNNLHITLQFLGYLTDEEAGEACLIVNSVAQKHDSFSLSLNEILYGPPKVALPKMIWAQGEKSEELSHIRQELEQALLERIAFVPENRTFAPHITLARINAWAFKNINPEERPEIGRQLDLSFTVESIEVMESEMKKGGPVYTVLESCQLTN